MGKSAGSGEEPAGQGVVLHRALDLHVDGADERRENLRALAGGALRARDQGRGLLVDGADEVKVTVDIRAERPR